MARHGADETAETQSWDGCNAEQARLLDEASDLAQRADRLRTIASTFEAEMAERVLGVSADEAFIDAELIPDALYVANMLGAHDWRVPALRAHADRLVARSDECVRAAARIGTFIRPVPEPSQSSRPVVAPDIRLRGEAPRSRKRRSQRETPLRAKREALLERVDADLPADAHARVTAALARQLDAVRASWSARRLLGELRRALAGATLADDLAEQLDGIAARLGIPPNGCNTADDEWLAHVVLELDDDEIAAILDPEGLDRDRGLALGAVRTRRKDLRHRQDAAARAGRAEALANLAADLATHR